MTLGSPRKHVWTYVASHSDNYNGGQSNCPFQELLHTKPSYVCTFNSCNMGRRVLPDMYTRIPRAAGPRDEGGHLRQNMTAHVSTIM